MSYYREHAATNTVQPNLHKSAKAGAKMLRTSDRKKVTADLASVST